MADNKTKSKKTTFWELITNYYITIPQIQREYSYGRRDETATPIREELLADMLKALTIPGEKIVLNFVYGKSEKDGDENRYFVPVDGQQRLTTLFLLHYYIFIKENDRVKLEVLEKFSYMTRDTTRRFCSKLCSLKKLDFEQEELHLQIVNQSWFTGQMKKDPTVDSMLKVLDDIHTTFKDCDTASVLKNLTDKEQCPITFMWLPMENFQQNDELYIKMNARGKVLSDTEIFKAKFQSSSTLELMLDCVDDDVEEKQRKKIEYISEFNNNFVELFFRYFKVYTYTDEEGNQKLISSKQYDELLQEKRDKCNAEPKLSIETADQALFSFIKYWIRNVDLVQLKNNNIDARVYREREIYDNIVDMKSGKFYRFIESGELKILKDALVAGGKDKDVAFKNELVEGFNQISKVLNCLWKKYEIDKSIDIESKLSKEYFSEIKVLQSSIPFYKGITFKENIYAYGMLSYIAKFGIPNSDQEKEGYNWWKRILYNLVENANLQNAENLVASLVFVHKYILRLSAMSKENTLDTLVSFSGEDVGAALSNILPEEICKVNLIKADPKWETAILEAENYYKDGAIGFLLRFASATSDYENIDIVKFNTYFNLSKILFKEDKKIQDQLLVTLELGLLCMPDENNIYSNDSGHLGKGKDSCTWCFYDDNFKEYLYNDKDPVFIKKQLRLKSLMDKLLANQQNQVTPSLIKGQIDAIIASDSAMACSAAPWKKMYIDNRNSLGFKVDGCTYGKAVAFVEGNVLIIIQGSQSTRGKSLDLKTYEMWLYMQNKVKDLTLFQAPTSTVCLEDFPYRTIDFSNGKTYKSIGWYNGNWYVEEINGQKHTEQESIIIQKIDQGTI